MRIDHRLGLRQPVRVDAVLDCPSIGTVPGRIVECSRSGVRVETAASLPLYARVTLIFVAPYRGAFRLHRVRGYVVRRSPTGVGVMLDDDVAVSALSALTGEDREGTPEGVEAVYAQATSYRREDGAQLS